MKKTLAAVLAAAMALSTATVAFAKDTMEGETILDNISTVSGRTDIAKGKEYSYVISADFVGDDGNEITATELGKWVKDGKANVTVTVTEGMSKLASKPTATVKNILTETTYKTVYQWTNIPGNKIVVEDKNGKKVTIANNGNITAIPSCVENGVGLSLDPDTIVRVIYPADPDWDDAYDDLTTNYVAGGIAEHVVAKDVKDSKNETAPVVQIKFKVADDWGTGSDDVGFKFRITFKKDVTAADGQAYDKGDTVMAGEALFSAKYEIMNDKGTEMELTREECKTNEFRQVLMNLRTAKLYDKIGKRPKFHPYSLRIPAGSSQPARWLLTQETLNMYYPGRGFPIWSSGITDVEFEFIEFKRQNPVCQHRQDDLKCCRGSTIRFTSGNGEHGSL